MIQLKSEIEGHHSNVFWAVPIKSDLQAHVIASPLQKLKDIAEVYYQSQTNSENPHRLPISHSILVASTYSSVTILIQV